MGLPHHALCWFKLKTFNFHFDNTWIYNIKEMLGNNLKCNKEAWESKSYHTIINQNQTVKKFACQWKYGVNMLDDNWWDISLIFQINLFEFLWVEEAFALSVKGRIPYNGQTIWLFMFCMLKIMLVHSGILVDVYNIIWIWHLINCLMCNI